MKKILRLGIPVFFSVTLYGQDSCPGIRFTPVNIISNPAFSLQGMSCRSGYIDANGMVVPGWYVPTDEMPTAYLNSCTHFKMPDSVVVTAATKPGMIQGENICLYPVVPTPIPGNSSAVIAFSDFGYTGDVNTYPYFKSYISTCLLSPLKKDSLYKFDFYLGFGAADTEYLQLPGKFLAPQSSLNNEEISIYGLADCSAATNPAPIVGCLIDHLNWILLGTSKAVSQQGTWLKQSIVFSPPQDISSIAIGPSCAMVLAKPSDTLNYRGNTLSTRFHSYFIVSPQFYESPVVLPSINLQGTLCGQSVTLEMDSPLFYTGSIFLWYRNDSLLSSGRQSFLTLNRGNNSQGKYRCVVQNDSICISSNSINIEWIKIPDADILGSHDTLVCKGDSILLNAFTDSTATYLWQDGTTNSTFAVKDAGKYSVSIKNACGTVQANKTVTAESCQNSVMIPTAFTPNGDGKNDFFKVHYSNTPEQFTMHIFNRLGQLLYSSSSPSSSWDGTFKGKPQETGVYIYALKYYDRYLQSIVYRKGMVVLIR